MKLLVELGERGGQVEGPLPCRPCLVETRAQSRCEEVQVLVQLCC